VTDNTYTKMVFSATVSHTCPSGTDLTETKYSLSLLRGLMIRNVALLLVVPLGNLEYDQQSTMKAGHRSEEIF